MPSQPKVEGSCPLKKKASKPVKIGLKAIIGKVIDRGDSFKAFIYRIDHRGVRNKKASEPIQNEFFNWGIPVIITTGIKISSVKRCIQTAETYSSLFTELIFPNASLADSQKAEMIVNTTHIFNIC